ncbi:glycosyltransferase family 2 protein [Roseofilum casamattae]|uniref:Glycosyltransferase family 2 protein n=1 Tax=Roseofilum casamattae BLCC-M143 TaxID=3022442 RepID=A0ABT7BZY7_9CYAN|nr:glycosyltransferase family 2 protein [Roseofilum casamattae]MDJ1184766.1 glycosyltransferase family 2 protein [Roseofilum casamattae BLCC-M143]
MLYLLIVNYYSAELIKSLLASVPMAEVHIIIVDNSPGDRALSSFTEQYPNLTLLSPGENLGFGGGCNLGLNWVWERDRQAIVWLINPDTTLHDGAIAYIRQCLHVRPDIAILGTQIVDSQGELWFTQGQFNPWLGSLSDREAMATSSALVAPCRWVSGCSLILNFPKFDRAPQFDRHYFLYYEDNDLCERYFQQGYAIAVTQAVLVTHQVSATSDRNLSAKFRHATYSKLYFLQSHGTGFALVLNLGYLTLKIIASVLQGNRAVAIGRSQGIQQFLFDSHTTLAPSQLG